MKTPILELVMCWKNDIDPRHLVTFVDMLERQRNTDLKDVVVTIMIMDNSLNIELPKKDIKYDIVHVNHTSLAKAYNLCIMRTHAPWIMFMDCGDFFPDVYSLSMILNLLPTDEYDMLWMERYNEVPQKSGNVFTSVVDDIDRKMNGKLFRTKYLLNNGLFFDEDVTHDIGDVFVMTAMSRTVYNRFVKIETKFVPYLHIIHKSQAKPTAESIVLQNHYTNMDIVRNVSAKSHGDFYMQSVMEAVCEGYYFMHMEPIGKAKKKIESDLRKLCKEKMGLISNVKAADIEVFLDQAQEKALAICNKAFIQFGAEMYFDVDDDPFTKWLYRMSHVNTESEEKPDKPSPKRKTRKRSNGKDKVAVYCGTRNVYESMVTSAKSLMYHTKMDRVYFLIEDDEFPHEVPDNVKCINVSNQEWFDPKGKNYKNSWTWMCMMRAAFAKLLPDEHQVLSLDVDVVVNDDISELWDIDLKDYYYAGVPETLQSEKKKDIYCNFGVIMMNLDRIRETGIDDTIIASLNRDKWGCPEQDAFNHFCAGGIYPLPSMYNAVRIGAITEETDVEKISHYAGIKYWKQFKPFRKFAGMSWEEVMK